MQRRIGLHSGSNPWLLSSPLSASRSITEEMDEPSPTDRSPARCGGAAGVVNQAAADQRTATSQHQGHTPPQAAHRAPVPPSPPRRLSSSLGHRQPLQTPAGGLPWSRGSHKDTGALRLCVHQHKLLFLKEKPLLTASAFCGETDATGFPPVPWTCGPSQGFGTPKLNVSCEVLGTRSGDKETSF